MTTKDADEPERLIAVEVEGQRRFATLNFAPDTKVYREYFLVRNARQYRVWDPYRSKLAAALLKGLRRNPILPSATVLYLGASTGTTVSHVSDLVGDRGVVFAVEVAGRVARELFERVARQRRNVLPIIADARNPEGYLPRPGPSDVLYCDIAQPDQTDIAIANAKYYLKKGGIFLLVVKARSIDVLQRPKEIFHEEVKRLERNGFKIDQVIRLDPYDKDHALIDAKNP